MVLFLYHQRTSRLYSEIFRWNCAHHDWTFVWYLSQDKNRFPPPWNRCTVGRRAISTRAPIFPNSDDLGSIVYAISRKIIIESQTCFCARLHISIARALIKRKLICCMLTNNNNKTHTEKWWANNGVRATRIWNDIETGTQRNESELFFTVHWWWWSIKQKTLSFQRILMVCIVSLRSPFRGLLGEIHSHHRSVANTVYHRQ